MTENVQKKPQSLSGKTSQISSVQFEWAPTRRTLSLELMNETESRVGRNGVFYVKASSLKTTHHKPTGKSSRGIIKNNVQFSTKNVGLAVIGTI